MTKEVKQEFTLRITQANGTQLVVILYEMLLCYLNEGEEALSIQNDKAFRDAVRKARGCMNELVQSVNRNYELAENLLRLYFYCIRRLARAEYKSNLQELENVRRVIQPLHDAYEKIAPQNQQGSIMNNSQEIYAGLTYGRNTLTENMTDQGTNRGMRV